MTKQTIIDALIKGGMDAADAEKAFNEAIPAATAVDADLMRENEMLKGRVKVREEQLKQAIDIANKANDAQKAREEAEKSDLIDRIKVDSNGKFTPDQLANKSLAELRLINTVLQTSMDQTFASVAALQAEQGKPKLYGIDYFDPKTQEWKVK